MHLNTAACAALVLGLPSMASAQSLDGAYRGMFVCQKAPVPPDILQVPLDIKVKGADMLFARPLFNWNGQRVVGSELSTGTVDADGKVHVTSSWSIRGISYQGDYSGTLTAAGGTLIGTQSWSGPNGISGDRTCTAALVSAPKAAHSPTR